VPADAAVFLGDTLATGYAAVQRTARRPGDTLAVVGGGPIGQLTSLAAQACGAGIVVLVEPVAARRDLAAAQGALVTDPDGARALVDRLTDGRGADAVVDAVGGPRGLDTAFALVRRRGSVVSVGVHADAAWALPVARAFTDELTLAFAVGDLARDAGPLVALVRSGAVDPAVVASETVPLDGVPEAYARMAERRTLKTLISV
jgi:threonine dehydrogenase-like Zn-dependent dehydrogenase